MFWRKKEKKPSPERMYEVEMEFQRLLQSGDHEKFMKFSIENFEELPEHSRKDFLIAAHDELREKVGQKPADEFVEARLKYLPDDLALTVKTKVWGSAIEKLGYMARALREKREKQGDGN